MARRDQSNWRATRKSLATFAEVSRCCAPPEHNLVRTGRTCVAARPRLDYFRFRSGRDAPHARPTLTSFVRHSLGANPQRDTRQVKGESLGEHDAVQVRQRHPPAAFYTAGNARASDTSLAPPTARIARGGSLLERSSRQSGAHPPRCVSIEKTRRLQRASRGERPDGRRLPINAAAKVHGVRFARL